MRTLLVVFLMLGVAGAALASVDLGSVSPTRKDPGAPYVNPPETGLRIAGDTIADPFLVTGLPFTGTGTTAGFFHDYDEACPYSGSTAPDVVYAYVADGSAASLNVDLCYSSYDTKVYVYEDAVTPGAPLACNDDFYFAAPCYIYSSSVRLVPVSAGHTYYIVIDGYGGNSGVYAMDVTDAGPPPPQGACCAWDGLCTVTSEIDCAYPWQGEDTVCIPNPCPPPPQIECPPGSLIEGEPPCNPGPADHHNGGCQSIPPAFQPLNPQSEGCGTMCGRSCATASDRDTDWFVSIGTGDLMTGTATAEFPVQYLIIYTADCTDLSYVYGTGGPGVPVTLSWPIADGAEVWNWIGIASFADWPESDYVLTVCGIKDPPPPPGACCSPSGVCMVTTIEFCVFVGGIFQGSDVECTPTTCQPVPVESKSWGALKQMYR